MKRTIGIIAIALAFVACGGEEHDHDHDGHDHDHGEATAIEEAGIPGYDVYGVAELTSIDGATAVAELPALMSGKDEVQVKLTGQIDEVCKKAGCWITVNLDDSTTMRVRFKDHFTIPTETGNEECVFEGIAYYDTVSVKMQKHYLEDAEAPQEEIDAITAPKLQLAFEATGIAIKK